MQTCIQTAFRGQAAHSVQTSLFDMMMISLEFVHALPKLAENSGC
jgi:hypothetical protein